MFIGRTLELAQLNKFHGRDGFEMLAVYGRRRVGKTELLTHFAQGKKTLFFSAEETTDARNLAKISERYGETVGLGTGAFPSWEAFFEAICAWSQNERVLLILDEFPYLVRENPAWMSMLQHLVDHRLKTENLMVVLCGSAVAFMQDEVLSQKSPLFGRMTGQLFVKPFLYEEAAAFFPSASLQQKLETYFILGGMPQYLRSFREKLTLEENIVTRILDASEALFEAPESMLRQELRTPATYNAILEAIAGGASRAVEILQKSGVQSGVGQSYLKTLMKLGLVDKRRPVGESNSRKTLYRMADPLFEFVLRFAYRYRSAIEAGEGQRVFDHFIEPQLSTHFGHQFESVCGQYLQKENVQGRLPDFFPEIGPWWGTDPTRRCEVEMDWVGLSKKIGLYAECKYRNEKVGQAVLEALQEKSQLLPRPQMHYWLFSKGGFTDSLLAVAKKSAQVQLVTLKDLFREKAHNGRRNS